jgi:hypothetical protein
LGHDRGLLAVDGRDLRRDLLELLLVLALQQRQGQVFLPRLRAAAWSFTRARRAASNSAKLSMAASLAGRRIA